LILGIDNGGNDLETSDGVLTLDNELKIKVYKATTIALTRECINIRRVDVSAPHAPIVK